VWLIPERKQALVLKVFVLACAVELACIPFLQYWDNKLQRELDGRELASLTRLSNSLDRRLASVTRRFEKVKRDCKQTNKDYSKLNDAVLAAYKAREILRLRSWNGPAEPLPHLRYWTDIALYHVEVAERALKL
jgi:hypothetical protein